MATGGDGGGGGGVANSFILLATCDVDTITKNIGCLDRRSKKFHFALINSLGIACRSVYFIVTLKKVVTTNGR